MPIHRIAGVYSGQYLPGFGDQPFWLSLIKVTVVFAFVLVLVLFAIVFERKVVGRMQNRIGPNRTGPWGVVQSLADAMKLMLKEEIRPVLADRPVYWLAPVASVVPAFLAFSVVPFGPRVSMFGHQTNLQVTDLPVGVLLVFACSSLAVYGIVLSGWASGSTYPLLGGLRAAAQMISYEIALGLSLATVFLLSNTMSTSGIVAAQAHHWWILGLFPSFCSYAVAVVGETNRAPFDLPEGESEIVGGFHTEYSSFKFAMFYLAEYANMAAAAAMAATLFLGGWRAPVPVSVWHEANTGWWPLLWFTAKVVLGLFVFVWLRGTLPRVRYDQFMALGWKVLIPGSLLWLLILTSIHVLHDHGWSWWRAVTVPGAITVLLIAVPALVIGESRRAHRRADLMDAERAAADAPPTFPIPPLDLVVPTHPRRRNVTGTAPDRISSAVTPTRARPASPR